MNPAFALLIFVIAAVATVVISIAIQQYSSKRSTYLADPSQLGDIGERRPSDGAVSNPTFDDEHVDGSTPTPEDERLAARAEQLEAVADRERQYAERAEAEARRLRGQGDDNLGPAPNEQRARRAGIATDDLDY